MQVDWGGGPGGRIGRELTDPPTVRNSRSMSRPALAPALASSPGLTRQ